MIQQIIIRFKLLHLQLIPTLCAIHGFIINSRSHMPAFRLFLFMIFLHIFMTTAQARSLWVPHIFYHIHNQKQQSEKCPLCKRCVLKQLSFARKSFSVFRRSITRFPSEALYKMTLRCKSKILCDIRIGIVRKPQHVR